MYRALRFTWTVRTRPLKRTFSSRCPGAQLANWIADSSNNQEFVLDLRTGQLVEVD